MLTFVPMIFRLDIDKASYFPLFVRKNICIYHKFYNKNNFKLKLGKLVYMIYDQTSSWEVMFILNCEFFMGHAFCFPQIFKA